MLTSQRKKGVLEKLGGLVLGLVLSKRKEKKAAEVYGGPYGDVQSGWDLAVERWREGRHRRRKPGKLLKGGMRGQGSLGDRVVTRTDAGRHRIAERGKRMARLQKQRVAARSSDDKGLVMKATGALESHLKRVGTIPTPGK